ncbi:MAG: tetratricopeptide repeat protein [Sulfitobacter sp.]
MKGLRWASLALIAVLQIGHVQAQQADITQEQIVAAAQSGQADAQYALGLVYHEGQGVLQDYAEAAHWFERAADKGHAAAQNHLARYRYEGLGGPKDANAALSLFEKAAESGDPQFVYDLALVSETDPNTLPRAVELYTQAAEAGHAGASVSLGVLYQDGKGVIQDFARARALYEGPANAGHARALNNLGLLYVRGNGVPQDYARAAEYFAKASEQGLPIAMTNLGVLYENGFGVPLDEAKAAALYRQGGGQSEVDVGGAQQQAPTLIYDDRLLPPDKSKVGLESLADKAEAGDPVALFQMGWLIGNGPDRPFDNNFEAAGLFRDAAELGHGPAMFNLGVMYFQALGLPQDYVLGHMWLLLAADVDVEGAQNANAYFATRLTSEQINDAQERARMWRIERKKNYSR